MMKQDCVAQHRVQLLEPRTCGSQCRRDVTLLLHAQCVQVLYGRDRQIVKSTHEVVFTSVRKGT
jgi:hypothetical protein